MSYTAKDIVMIMQRAARLGISRVSLGDIEIDFKDKIEAVPKEPSISQTTTTPQAEVVSEPQTVALDHDEKALETWRQKQEVLLNAPVLSPYEWEQEQANILQQGDGDDPGEIEDATSVQI